ncbi:MAG: hypothetical protein ACP5UA_10700 [Candidatus Hydrogenedens sp.]
MNLNLISEEISLNHFDVLVRTNAIRSLLKKYHQKSPDTSFRLFNLHCHSFFSYNGYGLSPTALVWKALQNNFYALGLVDFDVLDGVEEFLNSCNLCKIKGCAGFETRIFVPQFAQHEINSPGEPGISYHIGMGFTTKKIKKVHVLKKLKQIAQNRIRVMLERVNDYLSPLTIDYEKEVIPLTPAGNPTERHLCTAYYEKSKQQFPNVKDFVLFWSEKLKISEVDIEKNIANPVEFQNLLRAKLMKSRGPGYVPAKPENFPTLIEVNEFILANGAIPTFAWLDGTSSGEQNIEELLNIMLASGVYAVNIIPDRNWNINNLEQKQIKLKNLNNFISLASELSLPIFIGTELNAPGQKFVDNIDTPELQPYYQLFLDGVHIAYAHTILEQSAGMGFTSYWSRNYFANNKERYEFFKEIGERLTPVL